MDRVCKHARNIPDHQDGHQCCLSKKWKKKHLDEKIYFYIGPAGSDESTNKSKLIWCDLAAGAVVVINVVNDSVQIGILKNAY